MFLRRLFVSVLAVALLIGAGLLSRLLPDGQAAKDADAPIGTRMAQAAQVLLAGLSDANRAKSVFAFDNPVRTAWHYYPALPEPRKGAMLKEMSPKERELLLALLRTGTSP